MGLLPKLEFWLATIFYLIGTIVIMSEDPIPENSLMGINYLYDLLLLTAFYFSFLLLNFVVVPNIQVKEALLLNMGIIAVIIAVSIALFPDWEYNILLFSLTLYFTLKFSLLFLWKNSELLKKRKEVFIPAFF